MRYILLILSALFFSLHVYGEELSEESIYVSQLCHIVSGETQIGREQQYLNKMQEYSDRSQSSSALSKPEFNQETVREVIHFWLELDEKDRQALRADNVRCQQTLAAQFQQED